MWVHLRNHGQHLVGRVFDYLENIQPDLVRKVFGGVVTSAALSYLAVRGYRYYRARQVGKERGAAARQACQTLRDYLTEKEQEEGPANKEKEAMIVTLTLRVLREKLQKGELKAVQVLRAYQRKALEVNDRLNCITEPILEAEAMAVELDRLAPDQRGSLHGVPVSIKNSTPIKGYELHCGMMCFAGEPAKEDAVIMKFLKSLGAVPFVLTNTPQGLFTYACSNPIYGRTGNPYNVLRAPGGSSGGEGALIGAGGSLLGIGSDIGGSIRIPCQMCGAYGLKPTVDRLSFKGHISLSSGQTLVRATLGPMTRDLDSLIEVSKELFTPGMHAMDPTVPPLPFRQELFEKEGPLRVGFFTSLEEVGIHPACERAVLKAKAALERQGHKVVKFMPPRAYEAFCDLGVTALFADDAEESDQYMKDNVLDECVAVFYYIRQLPRSVRIVMSKLVGLFDPATGRYGLAACRLPRRILDWWHLQDKIQAYKTEFLEAWTRQKLDALICPGLPFPAVTAGIEYTGFPGLVYTALYNIVNYPAGMMPVGQVTQEDIQHLKDPSLYPLKGSLEKHVVKDSEGSEGLPIAVQCVALPFQEELVLRVMKDIDSVIRQ